MSRLRTKMAHETNSLQATTHILPPWIKYLGHMPHRTFRLTNGGLQQCTKLRGVEVNECSGNMGLAQYRSVLRARAQSGNGWMQMPPAKSLERSVLLCTVYGAPGP